MSLLMLNLSLWCMQNAYLCSAYTILPKDVQNLSVRFLFAHLISSWSILCPISSKLCSMFEWYCQKMYTLGWALLPFILHTIVLAMENLIKSLDLQYQKYCCGVFWIMYKRTTTGANFTVYFSVYWTPKFL